MINVIEPKKALEYTNRYFSMLSNTGYVKLPVVKRILLYLWTVDFVQTLYYFMSEKDYKKIEKLMNKVFSFGCCLLPYEAFYAGKTQVGRGVIGRAYHMGVFNQRHTEDSDPRRTEDDKLRTD